jgi:hypothetical protein
MNKKAQHMRKQADMDLIFFRAAEKFEKHVNKENIVNKF